MSYNANPQPSRPQSGQPNPLSARSAARAFAFFASAGFELASSTTQARQVGHTSARSHKSTVPVIHHAARAKLHLPPGVEDQPF
jgi:hypothetical protein